MIRYDYHCDKCGHHEEIAHSIRETRSYPCPKCGNFLGRQIEKPEYLLVKGGKIYGEAREQKGAHEKESMQFAREAVSVFGHWRKMRKREIQEKHKQENPKKESPSIESHTTDKS